MNHPISMTDLPSIIATGLMEEHPTDYPTRDTAEVEAKSLLWQVQAGAYHAANRAITLLYQTQAGAA